MAIKFCLDWNYNVKLNGECNKYSQFDQSACDNKDQSSAQHFAASIPSIITICDLVYCEDSREQSINKNFELPSQKVPKEYLTSFKILWRYEKNELNKKFRFKYKGPKIKILSKTSFIQNKDYLETFLNSSTEEKNYNDPETIKSRMDKTKSYNVIPGKKANEKSLRNLHDKNTPEANLDVQCNFDDEDFDVDEEVVVRKLPDSFSSQSLKFLDYINSDNSQQSQFRDDNRYSFMTENRTSVIDSVYNRNTITNTINNRFAKDNVSIQNNVKKNGDVEFKRRSLKQIGNFFSSRETMPADQAKRKDSDDSMSENISIHSIKNHNFEGSKQNQLNGINSRSTIPNGIIRPCLGSNIETKILNFKKKESNIKGCTSLIVHITTKIVEALKDLRFFMDIKAEKCQTKRQDSEKKLLTIKSLNLQLNKANIYYEAFIQKHFRFTKGTNLYNSIVIMIKTFAETLIQIVCMDNIHGRNLYLVQQTIFMNIAFKYSYASSLKNDITMIITTFIRELHDITNPDIADNKLSQNDKILINEAKVEICNFYSSLEHNDSYKTIVTHNLGKKMSSEIVSNNSNIAERESKNSGFGSIRDSNFISGNKFVTNSIVEHARRSQGPQYLLQQPKLLKSKVSKKDKN